MSTLIEKVLVIILIIVCIYAGVTTLQKNKVDRLYNEELQKNVIIISDSIEMLNRSIKHLRYNLEHKTDSVIIKYKYIHTKLLENEKRINNFIVTDSALYSFISEHEE